MKSEWNCGKGGSHAKGAQRKGDLTQRRQGAKIKAHAKRESAEETQGAKGDKKGSHGSDLSPDQEDSDRQCHDGERDSGAGILPKGDVHLGPRALHHDQVRHAA